MNLAFIRLSSFKEDVSIPRVLLLSSRYIPSCLPLGVNPLVAADEGDPTVLEALLKVRVITFEELVVGSHLCSDTNDGRALKPFPVLVLCGLKTHPIPLFLSSITASWVLHGLFQHLACSMAGSLYLSRQRVLPYLLPLHNLLQFGCVRNVEAMKAPLGGGRGSICALMLFSSCLIQETRSMVQYLRGAGVLEPPDSIQTSNWPGWILFAFMTSYGFNGRSSAWHTPNLAWVSAIS